VSVTWPTDAIGTAGTTRPLGENERLA